MGSEPFVLAESQPIARHRRPLRRVIVGVLVVMVVAAGVFGVARLRDQLSARGCVAGANGTSVRFDSEQSANAALISAIAVKRGLPPRAATIALATAIQESKLRNLTYGDRDSLGLFQQRPSQGWGTQAQILDPVYSTNKFYDSLVKINGYETMNVTKVAQQVQRSGYPEAYADHETEGRMLATNLTGQTHGGLACRLDPAEAASGSSSGAARDPSALVVADLSTQFGVSASTGGSAEPLTVSATDPDLAWAIGQWAVARADAYRITRVSVGDQEWIRGTGDDALSWHALPGSGNAPPPPTAVRISLAG